MSTSPFNTPAWAPVSTVDLFLKPLYHDWPTYAATVGFFFFCQYGSKFIMNSVSSKFRKLSEDDKNTWSVRFVSCVNSVMCARSSYLFLANAFKLPSETDLYQTIPGYRLQSILLASYFMWDVVVCILYKWGALYTVHGIASGLGVFMTTWPFAERWVGWFSGVFELSNVLIHSAEMLAALDSSPAIVAALKGLFSVLFILIRPIGGSYIGYKFTVAAIKQLTDADALANRTHHIAAPIACIAVTWTLMSMQYLWTTHVLRGIGAALGLCDAGDIGDTKSANKKEDDDKKKK
jgi:hypothetical protein